ncbi:MAG: hypothetical protein AB2L20_07430 [Mangrovibacterium sp.]
MTRHFQTDTSPSVSFNYKVQIGNIPVFFHRIPAFNTPPEGLAYINIDQASRAPPFVFMRTDR